MDKAWDAVHRCLTDGSLRCRGNNVLELFVLGGLQLHRGPGHIVSYLTPHQVQAVSHAAQGVAKKWFGENYFDLANAKLGWFGVARYEGPIGDDDFEYSWDYFEEARKLYRKAAIAGRAMIFTVDQ